MNISPDDIAVSVNAFMAQRLVRKLCECKEKYALSPEERALIQKVVSEISPETKVPIPETEFAFRPKGCPKCNNLGFSGRTTISEILLIDKTIEALINEKASLSKIQETAQASGMLTMLQDGILKVLEGETSLSEIERVTEV